MIKFIAELGSNHNGNLQRALDLIEVAAKVGCAGVKFQLFEVDKLYHSSILNDPQYSHLQERKNWELPAEWLPELIDKTKSLGMIFGCTPFSLNAIEILSQLDINYYKISSYDIINYDLIERVAETQRPIMISTGLANRDEVDKVLERLDAYKVSHNNYPNVHILYCVSNYPVSPDRICLSRMEEVIPSYIMNIGLSDHSVNPGVIFRAIYHYFCSTIEFHLDLEDKQGFEYGAHCWTPQRIEQVIKWVKNGFDADGPDVEDLRDELNWRASPADGLRPLETIRNVG